jgi:ABC-type transport system substrate-binding protein
VLKAVAANELKSQFEKTGKPAPKLTPLTLGHPADEISRIACRALSRQWKTIGIDVNLIEFPPGVFIDQKAECDLVYTQGATWEPIVDAGRLFAPGGLTPVDNSYVNLMLRKVESARDWVEARQGLRDLHRQLHEDVSVIPLWQTFDFYAWRRSVQGIQDGQSSLYQTIGQWQVAPRLANN